MPGSIRHFFLKKNKRTCVDESLHGYGLSYKTFFIIDTTTNRISFLRYISSDANKNITNRHVQWNKNAVSKYDSLRLKGFLL